MNKNTKDKEQHIVWALNNKDIIIFGIIILIGGTGVLIASTKLKDLLNTQYEGYIGLLIISVGSFVWGYCSVRNEYLKAAKARLNETMHGAQRK